MIHDHHLAPLITRAKELLATCRHAAMATVNADGSPHNTPYYFMYDEPLEHLYWGSHPASVHSQNIERTGQIYVVLYDARERGGLYIKAENAHRCGPDELDEALRVHNRMRARDGKRPLEKQYYETSEQEMYKAMITGFWVNKAKRDAAGYVAQDLRWKIAAKDLR